MVVMINALIVSARKRGEEGKGDQVVLKQIKEAIESEGGLAFYVFIQFAFWRKKSNEDADLIIKISFRSIICAFYCIIFKGWPIQTALFSNPVISRNLRQNAPNNFNLLLLSQERMHGIEFFKVQPVFLFIDALAHNLRTRKYRSSFLKLFWHYEASRLELAAKNRKAGSRKIFISEDEAGRYNLPNSFVLPNFIHAHHNHKKYSGVKKSFDLVMSGNFNYRPNIDAVEWLIREWPVINKTVFLGRESFFWLVWEEKNLRAQIIKFSLQSVSLIF